MKIDFFNTVRHGHTDKKRWKWFQDKQMLKEWFVKRNDLVKIVSGALLIVVLNIVCGSFGWAMKDSWMAIASFSVYIILIGPVLIRRAENLKVNHKIMGTILNFVFYGISIALIVITIVLIIRLGIFSISAVMVGR